MKRAWGLSESRETSLKAVAFSPVREDGKEGIAKRYLSPLQSNAQE